MLFTTNKPLAAWGLVLHDPDLAEAILDRVLERGRLVELRGASYRTRHLKRAEPDRSPLREGAIISGNQGPEFPEPTALFRWEREDCASPPFRLGWRVSSDSVFDVNHAEREVVFRFDPAVSLMAVRNWGDSSVFERGVLTWKWRGTAPAFWIGYEP